MGRKGIWVESAVLYSPGVADDWISPSTRASARVFAFTVRGDSMEPQFTEEDALIVDPGLEARHGGFVIGRLDGAREVTFKQLVIDEPQRFLKPLNKHYPVIQTTGMPRSWESWSRSGRCFRNNNSAERQ